MEIWTIGHSTHSLGEFTAMLKFYEIEMLVDIRRFPGSRKYPHFNKDALEISLPKQNLEYLHLENLGGRRKADPDSENTVWRHPSFRGYADFMETKTFDEGTRELEKIATKQRTAIMCSEAVWWSCHRSMVSDYLKAKGWKVMHIMGLGKGQEHPYTQPARVVDGELSYKGE